MRLHPHQLQYSRIYWRYRLRSTAMYPYTPTYRQKRDTHKAGRRSEGAGRELITTTDGWIDRSFRAWMRSEDACMYTPARLHIRQDQISARQEGTKSAYLRGLINVRREHSSQKHGHTTAAQQASTNRARARRRKTSATRLH